MSEKEKYTDNIQFKVPYFMSHRAPLYFLFFSTLCQFIAFGALSFLKDYLSNIYLMLLLHSVIAFLLARWLKMSLPWQLFNFLLAPGVLVYTSFSLPPGLATLALILAILIYLPTFWTRVPYFPTHKKMYESILAELPEDKAFKFIDLGCGFGSLILYLARRRPQGQFEGVEISPMAYLLTKIRMALLGVPNIEIKLKNFWNISLAPYDVVYAFLSPAPMPALWDKLSSEMKKGSLFISNTFEVAAEAYRIINVDDTLQGKLHLHRF